jgi:hypothetical protein
VTFLELILLNSRKSKMKAFKSILAIAAGLSALGNVAPAFSQIVSVKDTDGRVYVRGLTPQAPVDFTFIGTTQSRQVVSNSCGAVIIRGTTAAPLAASITVGSSPVDVASLPLGLLPTCTAGAFTVPVTSNFKTATGQVVVIGQTPNTAILVSQLGDRVRRVTPNTCGFARLASSANFTLGGTFTVSGTSLNVDSIATGLPPICRTGVLYLPVSAPSVGG